MNSATLEFEPKLQSVPYVYTKLSPAKPTIVFDSYWKFAAERQSVLYKRINGFDWPWTKDPIIGKHKFTNVYRVTDRVSQYLVKNIIYNPSYPQDSREVFFRIMLFKLFNKIETWEKLSAEFGSLTYSSFDIERYDKVLMQLLSQGDAIYSAAYIMPSGKNTFGYEKKHKNHLALIQRMIAERLPEKIEQAKNMQRTFELLKGYPSIGDFLAYQYAIDINYSNITDFTESDFVIPGPGAKGGISKCFTDLGGLSEIEIIKLMMDRQDIEFERLGLDFKKLGNRSLQLIDCQNIFCETDKYARIAHPDIRGNSDRLRIKQNFTSRRKTDNIFLPPKWGIKNPLKDTENKSDVNSRN